MRIIDMHAHIDICEPLHWYDTAEKLLLLMDEAGIEKAVVSAYLNLPGPDMGCADRLWKSIEPYSDRFVIDVFKNGPLVWGKNNSIFGRSMQEISGQRGKTSSRALYAASLWRLDCRIVSESGRNGATGVVSLRR